MFRTTSFLILWLGCLLIAAPLQAQQDKDDMFHSYKKQWAKIDSLEGKGLTRDALASTSDLYERARQAGEDNHLIKAIMYQMKYTNVLEEKSDSLNIELLKAEIAANKTPVSNILQLKLGDIYLGYYEQNRWRINERTETQVQADDFQTWDVKTLMREAGTHYLEALDNSETLQKLDIDDFALLLRRGEQSTTYRPTLYDILAHTAIDFFSSSETWLSTPVYQFELPADKGLLPAEEFAQQSFETRDKDSRTLKAVNLFQEVLAFHLKTENTYALIDADIKRLNFAREHAVGEQKDSLYLKALQTSLAKYESHPASSFLSFEVASVYKERAGKYQPHGGEDYKNDYKRAMAICQSAIDRHPKSEGANKCRSLQATIQQHNLELNVEEVNLQGQPFRMLLQYRNLEKLYFRVITVDKSLREKINQYRYGANEDLAEILRNQPILNNWSLDLPEDPDFHRHSLEMKIPALGLGEYAIVASDHEDFIIDEHAVAFVFTQVSHIGYFSQVMGKTREIYVRDRETGKPIKGASVQAYRVNYREGTEVEMGPLVTTDKAGKVRIEIEETRDYLLEIRKGEDVYKTGRLYDSYYRQYPEISENLTRFFLDRTIYRPGQAVYFKGLMLTKTGDRYEVLPKHTSTVTFYDANNQKVGEQELTTNAYGSFSGSFTAPNTGLLGSMHLKGEKGSIYFRVEEYKRPKFEVKINPLEGSYRLGESVVAQGEAKAYAGNAIDGAEVRYRVVRTARFPFWGYFRWWMPRPSSPEREITSGTTTTDKEGKFEIPFSLIPDGSLSKESKPQFTYTVEADVIDISGETRSGSSRVMAAYVALEVDFALSDRIQQDQLSAVKLFTRNLSGEPEPVEGTVKVYRLQEPGRLLRNRRWSRPDKHLYSQAEYEKFFPNDIYDNEQDPRSWEKGEPILDTDFNTHVSSEFELDFLENAKPGRYLFALETQDAYGEEVKVNKYTTLVDPEDSQPALPNVLGLVADKSSSQPGEKVTFSLRSSVKKLEVMYFIEHNGQLLGQGRVKLKKATEIVIPVREEHRGGIRMSVAAICMNEFYGQQKWVAVPWTNKELSMEWSTFRSELLPGSEESWKLKVKGPEGDRVAAEAVLAMYDASLEAFSPANQFALSLYPTYRGKLRWTSGKGFHTQSSRLIAEHWDPGFSYQKHHSYDEFETFGFFIGGGFYGRRRYAAYGLAERSNMAMAAAPPGAGGEAMDDMAFESKASGMGMADEDSDGVSDLVDKEPETPDVSGESLDGVPLRTNFNETAFFLPQLETDEEGNIVFDFTMPEALTRWRLVGLAHTEDLKVGTITGETVTQKDLMVVPNLPRFLREGDKIRLTAKVSNVSEGVLEGSAQLFLLDAFTLEPVDAQFGHSGESTMFKVEAGQSTALAWDIEVPENVQAVVTRIVAKAGAFSDGEENVLPILSNRMLVTESKPLPIRGNETREFTFDKLLASGESSTLRHQRLTLEFTSNPAWYAVQALPYLMEYPHECAEQIFSRFYANALASHIATSTPKIQRVFEQWRSVSENDAEARNALMSALATNQELKAVLLEETPWVLNANNERERKQRIGLLFDLNKMADESARAKAKLGEMQYSTGGFPWFPEMTESRYITNIVATGMGHLSKLGVGVAAGDPELRLMTTKAVVYLDLKMKEDYERLKARKGIKMEENHLFYSQINYLYMRSFYPDVEMTSDVQEAYDYYYAQAKTFWPEQSNYMKGMISLVLHRRTDNAIGKEVIESLRQNAINHPELGMYWKQAGGWFWYQAPIEEQALLIEAFEEVDRDRESVEGMKIWLLKNKQTNDWKTTRATVAACNALLMTGAKLLESDQQVQVSLGGQEIDPYSRPDAKVEAGTGYYKTAWLRSEVKPEMGTIKVEKKDDGIAWGALYWQYFEDLDNITYAETPLSLKRALYKEVITEEGKKLVPLSEDVSPGDKVIVRIELRVDRAMEYVHMKDLRASGFEPLNVLSQYKYQDGLGYYESTKDAATHFFFSYLQANKTYVFEYPLRVTHEGDFSNGVTSIQCMYAPEYTSHSDGIRVKVD